MSIERGDLRKTIFPGSKTYPVTDADLAALGYVRLDVDVDELRSSLVNPKAWESEMTWRRLTLQVLAALDGEEA